ncbi:MAG: nucleoside recognition family protein [Rhodospirillales bacterium]
MTDIILPAGQSAMNLVLFIILPVMVVMLTLMRLLELTGFLDWMVAKLAPMLRPFGLTGLGVFAALQVNLVSFAAPIATLAIMDKRGASDRHLAATLAMVCAMSQANASLPLTAMGLRLGPVLVISVVGGLAAAAATYHWFGRKLSAEETVIDDLPHHAEAHGAKGVLDTISRAGGEAFTISIGAIPFLILSLVVINILRQIGAIDALTALAQPLLQAFGIDPALVLLTITKYLAGGTATLGVIDEMVRQHHLGASVLNQSAGFLIHPFDLPGFAILISAGRRIAAVWKPAAFGACVGIAVRTLLHIVLG